MMKRDKGFTIVEVMMAIAIFGFLMVMIAQIMSVEIRMFSNASKQSEIEEKARTAMVQIMDEIRVNRYTAYFSGTAPYHIGEGINLTNPPQGLININPGTLVLTEIENGNLDALMSGTKIYFDQGSNELWYRDTDSNSIHLIADNISFVIIREIDDHLVQIHVKAQDDSGNSNHELLTWVRLY